MAIVTKIQIEDDFINLAQFLKLTDYINSGGEAKFFLAENEVFVNGEKETKRGRKLHNGDEIMVNKDKYTICI